VRENVRTWEVESDGSWSSDGVLKLRFDRTRDDGVNRPEFMTISIRDGWLRLRTGVSEGFVSAPLQKRDDIELLSVGADGMTFTAKYRRQTAPKRSLQVQDVYVFRVTDSAFEIDRASYVQGRMAARSTWKLHR
jgi:hypothetical protein